MAAQRLLYASVLVYLTLGAAMIALGRVGDSGAMLAEGWHTVGDGLLGVVLLVSARVAARGVDAAHPHGRDKFEHLGAAILGGVLMVLAAEAALDLVGHAITGEPHRLQLDGWPMAVAVAIPIVRALWVGVFLFTVRRSDSVAVRAEVRHAVTDAIVTTLATVAAIAGHWAPWVDVLGAGVIVAVIAWVGSSLVREHAPWLADRALVAPEDVARAITHVEGVEARRIRSRGTPSRVFVDLLLALPAGLSLRDAGDLSHSVSDAVRAAHPNVVDVVVQVVPEGRIGRVALG